MGFRFPAVGDTIPGDLCERETGVFRPPPVFLGGNRSCPVSKILQVCCGEIVLQVVSGQVCIDGGINFGGDRTFHLIRLGSGDFLLAFTHENHLPVLAFPHCFDSSPPASSASQASTVRCLRRRSWPAPEEKGYSNRHPYWDLHISYSSPRLVFPAATRNVAFHRSKYFPNFCICKIFLDTQFLQM